MNQIDLMSSNPQPVSEPSLQQSKVNTKIQANRPSNLTVSKIFSPNQKWRQCKIIGKNISIRSYSAACAFQEKFYVYGGYQILNGSLSDFYSIDLDDSQPKFNWQQIIPKNNVSPGARSKHALIGGKQKIYLIGGLHQDINSSNDIWQWDPKTQNWKSLKPEGHQHLPKLDSFGCILIEKQGIQKIYIIGGYNGQKAEMSNAVYQYIPSSNKITILFENQPTRSPSVMHTRCGHAVTTDKQNIFIFGGKNQQQRFNDLWIFDLKTQTYELLPASGDVPAIRNGHTMNFFIDRLYVFGGIHDITWELDDLHIYNLIKKNWTTLQQDSPRKLQKRISPEQSKGDKSIQKKVNKKKNWYQTVGNQLNPSKVSSTSPMINTTIKKNFSTAYNTKQQQSQSPGKMIDEQRKKVFYQKKAQMLKNFQVDQDQKEKYILLQTSSQAMKNSLDVIGNPGGKPANDKLTEFGKQSHSKFLAPLQNNLNLVIGKKPCARDGHCSTMLNDQLIIFGGDRHQMSFNDIYKLNFSLAHKQTDK